MDPDYKPVAPQSGQEQNTYTPIAPDSQTLQVPLSSPVKPKNRKNKLIIILILVLILVAGGAYFLTKRDKAEAPASVTSDSEVSEPTGEIACKEGETEYTNDDVDIKFCYPSSWGEAVTVAGQEEESPGHLVAGSQKVITFTGNDTVKAGVASVDWEHDPNMGHDGLSDPGLPTMTQAKQAKEYLLAGNILRDSDNQFAYLSVCGFMCTAESPYLQLQFFVATNSETYTVIEFVQVSDTVSDNILDEFGMVKQDTDLSILLTTEDSQFIALQRVADTVQ